MKFALARHENQTIRNYIKCFALGQKEIEIENDFARECDGERAWTYKYCNILRTTNAEEIKTIGGSRRMVKKKYIVFNWVGGGSYHYMEPPEEPEPIEVDEFDNLADAFVCIEGIAKSNEFNTWSLAEWESKQADDDVSGDLLSECRECGKNSYGCIYCDECGEKQKCAHGNKLGDCDACDFAADLACDAARGR